MSDYDYTPKSPRESSMTGIIFDKINEIENAPTPKTGIIMDDPKKEQLAQDLILDGNPLGSVGRYAASSLREEACTPSQIQNLEEERRTDGIPIVQGLVMAAEKSASAITGNDVQFDSVMRAASIVDRFGKPIMTGGASLAADSLYEAGRDAKDAATCMTMEKDIELPYYGENKYDAGQYPYDVQVYAQSNDSYYPQESMDKLSQADMNEIRAMYSPDNTFTPSGAPNPNASMPRPGDLVEPAPESRTPLNVRISPRPEMRPSGPGM